MGGGLDLRDMLCSMLRPAPLSRSEMNEPGHGKCDKLEDEKQLHCCRRKADTIGNGFIRALGSHASDEHTRSMAAAPSNSTSHTARITFNKPPVATHHHPHNGKDMESHDTLTMKVDVVCFYTGGLWI